jgi:tRNA pseudouridine38-40 synthase
MMRRLKLILEYDGSHFFGWQVQARTGERTVQAVLQEAFAGLPGEHTSPHAAGRTDAGVHALAMVAHLDSSTRLDDAQLLRALNAHLPVDLRVLSVETVAASFHAQFDCTFRRYLYRMRSYREDLRGSSLDRKRVLALYQKLDVVAMQKAAPLFEGSHDFKALATQEIRATKRTVYCSKLRVEGRDLTYHVAADGFLRNMVRAMVGTLLRVGEGKLEPEAVRFVLASGQRSQAGENVPPQGLYFAEASYEPWQEKC